MKKRFFTLMVVFAMMLPSVFAMNFQALSTESVDVILHQYTEEELNSVVFTMDLFNSAFSREDVANKIALNKATASSPTNLYVHYSATEKEIDDYYAKMEAIALAERPLSYYFSNVYWRTRNGVVTLTLVPTSAMKEGNPDGYNTAPAWLLVERECENSSLWTNASSLNKQFYCHAQGEILRLRGIIDEDVGDWDLEPHRSDTFYFDFVANRCNP